MKPIASPSGGHDFRPSYRLIIQFIQKIEERNKQVKVLGLTATANDDAERDILRQLKSSHQQVVVHRASMIRENIALSVIKCRGLKEKLNLLEKMLRKLPAAGINLLRHSREYRNRC